MVKKDFLVLLKEVSDKLNEKDIKHEIPYCHIDKMDFNHIYIIVPDFINYDELESIGLSFVKDKEGIIYTKKDSFPVNFVKTSEKLWGYTFHYYCWNTLNIYIDCIYDYFNITYDRFGIKYNYNDKKIFITSNLKDIIEFIGLDFKFFALGFPTSLVINSFVESSDYYDTRNFKMGSFKRDPIFELNKDYYKEFIKHKSESKGTQKTEEEKIALIDANFKNDFIKKLYRLQLKDNLPEGVKYQDKKIDKKVDVIMEKPQKKKISLKNFFKSDNKDFNLE